MTAQNKIILQELLSKLDFLISELEEINVRITFKSRRRKKRLTN
ncbi:MAG: hypothetical protein ACD_19C00139G0004 [uncultured bacterium]|nr:MAG: hypothetical protein ACD_19C00139G0004 [uncultured bacterium]